MFKLNLLEKLAIVFIVAILGYVGYNWWQGKKVDKLEVVNAVQQGVIKSQEQTIQIASDVAEIKEIINVQVQQDERKVEKKHQEIKQKTEQREADINIQFAQEPVTAESVVAKHEEISKVRIDGLWEAYCSEAADAIQCIADNSTEGTPNV